MRIVAAEIRTDQAGRDEVGLVIGNPPAIGSENDELLNELGYDAEAIAKLRADGSIA